MFEFEAVFNAFPGYDGKGNHAVPTQAQMERHWSNTLGQKVLDHKKIWLLGNVAMRFIVGQREKFIGHKKLLITMHPSKRNMDAYRKVKGVMLDRIKNFIYD